MPRKKILTGVPLASLLPSWELTLQEGNKSPKTLLSYLGTAGRLVAFLKDHGMPDDTEGSTRRICGRSCSPSPGARPR